MIQFALVLYLLAFMIFNGIGIYYVVKGFIKAAKNSKKTGSDAPTLARD